MTLLYVGLTRGQYFMTFSQRMFITTLIRDLWAHTSIKLGTLSVLAWEFIYFPLQSA